MIDRKATLRDAENMFALVNHYAEKGLLLSRSRHQLYEGIRDYVVVESQGEIIGMGALHIMWFDLAEIRSLAVAAAHMRKGVGRRIVEILIEEGNVLGIKKFFALTYQQDFFSACGFRVEDKENMPQKVWMDCINCPKFPNCDEICMTRSVN